jgi:hypothetical protein
VLANPQLGHENENQDRDQGTWPLSFAQQRLWFIQQLRPEGTEYLAPLTLRIEGAFNLPAFRQAFQALAKRHEAFRTVFGDKDGVPYQRILDQWVPSLEQVDLRQYLRQAGSGDALGWLRRQLRAGIGLSADRPAVEATLARIGEDEHLLLIKMHHILVDGWPLEIIWTELGLLYEAFSANAECSLPELPFRYVDYASRQREWLRGQALEERLNFWRSELDGLEELAVRRLDEMVGRVVTNGEDPLACRARLALVRDLTRGAEPANHSRVCDEYDMPACQMDLCRQAAVGMAACILPRPVGCRPGRRSVPD